MKCCIVVLNYNDFQTTFDFVNQIKEYNCINKIIIVDNHSTDDSYIRLQKLASEKIDIILSKENKGYAAGNNLGIHRAQTLYNAKYIIISNPDVIVSQESIVACLEFLDNHIEYGIVTAQMIEKGNSQSRIAWRLPNYMDCLFLTIPYISKFKNEQIKYDMEQNKFDVIDVEVVPGSFFVTRSNYMSEIDNFDERTFLYCEEDILGFKMKQQGYKTAVLATKSYIHNHSISINKSVQYIEKFKILNKSREIYLEQYLKINRLQLNIFRLLSKLMVGFRYIHYKYLK